MGFAGPAVLEQRAEECHPVHGTVCKFIQSEPRRRMASAPLMGASGSIVLTLMRGNPAGGQRRPVAKRQIPSYSTLTSPAMRSTVSAKSR
jgi:hypothetical protein